MKTNMEIGISIERRRTVTTSTWKSVRFHWQQENINQNAIWIYFTSAGGQKLKFSQY